MKLRLTDTIIVVTSDKIVIRGWRSVGEADRWLEIWINDQRSRWGHVTRLREIVELEGAT